MDKNALTILLIVGLVVAGTAGGMAYVEAKRAREERVRAEALERQLEAAAKAEMGLRAEAKAELAALRNPPEDKPNCLDSDAKYGADAIYVRGSVHSGSATSSDHCRLGQLVEFSCIENPPGSGRTIRDTTIADCPSGSRCVAGECLR